MQMSDKFKAAEMRDLLFARLRKICMGQLPGTNMELHSIASTINKSIDLECQKEHIKMQYKLASQRLGKPDSPDGN